jgi:hypothetical protein
MALISASSVIFPQLEHNGPESATESSIGDAVRRENGQVLRKESSGGVIVGHCVLSQCGSVEPRTAPSHRPHTNPPTQNQPNNFVVSKVPGNHRPTNLPIDSGFCRQSTSHRHDGYVTQPPRSLCVRVDEILKHVSLCEPWPLLLPVENSSSPPAVPAASVESMHRRSKRASLSIPEPKG